MGILAENIPYQVEAAQLPNHAHLLSGMLDLPPHKLHTCFHLVG